MSKLKNEIKACMSELLKTENQGLSGKFSFPKEFLGFQGHFPGNPILPGVCKIQAAILMLEEAKKKPLRLKEIILAKFFAPVTANEEVIFNLKELDILDSEEEIEVLVSAKDKKIAQLKLRVSFEK